MKRPAYYIVESVRGDHLRIGRRRISLRPGEARLLRRDASALRITTARGIQVLLDSLRAWFIPGGAR